MKANIRRVGINFMVYVPELVNDTQIRNMSYDIDDIFEKAKSIVDTRDPGIRLDHVIEFKHIQDINGVVVEVTINTFSSYGQSVKSHSIRIRPQDEMADSILAEEILSHSRAFFKDIDNDLEVLDEIAECPNGLLIARDGQIDLAGTSASNDDLAPRVEAAKVAIEDLIEACARSNLHSPLHRFSVRYQAELNKLHTGATGLIWYIVAQQIEIYRATYNASSERDAAEYPPMEPNFATVVDTVLLATAMLARVFPEIARSQDDVRKYAGEQVEARTAVREIIDPALFALSSAKGILTPRAAEVTGEAASFNLRALPDDAPVAVRVRAAKVGLFHGFLSTLTKLAIEATHQAQHLRENIRTKGLYDLSKEVVKWLVGGGYGNALAYITGSVSMLLSLAYQWPAMFDFVIPLLRVLGLHP